MLKYVLLAIVLILPACDNGVSTPLPQVSDESVAEYTESKTQEIDAEDTSF